MFQLFEHAGFEKAHDPHTWWTYEARVTSPKTCELCIALDGTNYRGDELDLAFPYHIHLRVNAIKANTHMPRDPYCRCLLRWAGRTKDVLEAPYGMRKPRKPKIPKKVKLVPDEKRMFKKVAKHARETWRQKRERYARLGLPPNQQHPPQLPRQL